MQRNVHTTFLRLLFFHFSHASVIFFIVFMLINRSWTVNRKFDQGLASFFDDTNARSDWDFQFLADNGVQDNPRKPVKILFRRGDGWTMIPFWQVTMTFLLLQKQGGAQFKTNVEKSWAVKIRQNEWRGHIRGWGRLWGEYQEVSSHMYADTDIHECLPCCTLHTSIMYCL